MDKYELAQLLNGREYRSEISEYEKKEAKVNGLIVIFGYSDDNVCLEGAISDEIGAFGNISFYITKSLRTTATVDDVESELDDSDIESQTKEVLNEAFKEYCKNNSKEITIEHDKEGYSWFIQTNSQFATFDIMEGGEKFCRGIVISKNDLYNS